MITFQKSSVTVFSLWSDLEPLIVLHSVDSYLAQKNIFPERFDSSHLKNKQQF